MKTLRHFICGQLSTRGSDILHSPHSLPSLVLRSSPQAPSQFCRVDYLYGSLYHPYTALLCYIIPIVLSLVLITHYYEPVHVAPFNVFLISVLLVGTLEHSGYDFAQPPVSKVHDLHHEKFNVNNGSLHFMDWLQGTDVLERGATAKAGKDSRRLGKLEERPFLKNVLGRRKFPGWE